MRHGRHADVIKDLQRCENCFWGVSMPPQPDLNPEPLLNATQLAKHLGVDQSQVSRWRKDGIIPAEISEGRCHRYDLNRVREHLAKRAAKNQKGRS